jgi:hypothetical protein
VWHEFVAVGMKTDRGWIDDQAAVVWHLLLPFPCIEETGLSQAILLAAVG